jgi:dephospho-CoA kinase
MLILGLTGSIAMGKSRAAATFDLCGAPVFDADQAVHRLFSPGSPTARAVATAFPASLDMAGQIDRGRLGGLVFTDPPALRRLEAIIHPAVRAAEGRFLRRCCRAGLAVAVLDIPLLYETGGEARCDRVAVVSAHPVLQEQRALARPNMTADRLAGILRKQTPDAVKRRRADFVIPSGQDRGLLIASVRRVLAALVGLKPWAWPNAWHGARV